MNLRQIICMLFVAFLIPHASPAMAQAPDVGDEAAAKIAEGVALHNQGDYDGAITKYRQVLASDPGNTEALYEISYAQLAKGDYTGCIKTAEGALKKAEARDTFERALAEAPRHRTANLARTRAAATSPCSSRRPRKGMRWQSSTS